jgi:hypothetical protein
MKHSRPYLSICIPTYNHAVLLESALLALIDPINALSPRVELIVSDNKSDDHTPEVINKMSAKMPLRHYTQPENTGFYGNFFTLMELAQGHFSWVIGDDDLVKPDGLVRILRTIEENQEVDYIFANCDVFNIAEREAFDRPVVANDFAELSRPKSKIDGSFRVERWEELVDPKFDNVFLGSIQVSVFRTDLMKQTIASYHSLDQQFHRLNYFNTELLARSYLGQPAYFIGTPCSVVFVGGQHWFARAIIIYMVTLEEMLDNYLKLGIPASQVKICRLALLEYQHQHHWLTTILTTPDLPGRNQFSLWRYIWQHRCCLRQLYPNLAHAFRPWLRHILPDPVINLWRRIKSLFRFGLKVR